MDTRETADEPANSPPARVRSGAYAKSPSALRIRADRVRYLVRRYEATNPHLTEADRPVLRWLCELDIIGAAMFAAVLEVSVVTSADGGKDVQARRLVSDHRANRQTATQIANALGITPSSRKAVLGDKTGPIDVAEFFANEIDEERAEERKKAKRAAKEGKDDE